MAATILFLYELRDSFSLEVLTLLRHYLCTNKFAATVIAIDDEQTNVHITLGVTELCAPQFEISFCNSKIHSHEIVAFFFRRWYPKFPNVQFISPKSVGANEHAARYLKREHIEFSNDFLWLLHSLQIPRFGDPGFFEVSKFQQLVAAQQSGFTVPNTIVTTSYENARRFVTQTADTICKALYAPGFQFIKNSRLVTLDGSTELIQEHEISVDYGSLQPCVIQDRIIKTCDIRVFYFQETCYAMIIDSTVDLDTNLDFRNYKNKPPYCYPHKLPVIVRKKIISVAKALSITTGSFDFVLTATGDYVFLEVNTMGQLEWLYKYCQYTVPSDVANYLIKHSLNANG